MENQEKALAVMKQGNIMEAGTFQQMLAVSEFLSKGDLIPAHFKGRPANVFVALEFSLRTGMSVFPIMQNMYVVHGRPGIEAKLAIALLNSSGIYDEPLEYDIVRDEKTGKIKSCTAWTTRRGIKVYGPPVTAEMVHAEKWDANKPIWKDGKMTDKVQVSKWNTMEEMMYRYRAATFFVRVRNPEVLMGLQTAEELEDVVEMAQVSGAETGGTFFTALPEEEVDAGVDVFATLVDSYGGKYVPTSVDSFVKHCAEVYKKSSDEIKAKASVNPDNFFEAFEKWVEKQGDKKTRKPRSDAGKSRGEKPPEPPQEAISPDPGESTEPVPNNGSRPHAERLVDPDTVQELILYCQQLGLNPDQEAAKYRADGGAGVKLLTNEEAGKMLGNLLDRVADK